MRGTVRAALTGAALLFGMCTAVPQAAAEDAIAIGDSITIAAETELERAGYTVDAVTGRTFAEGVDLVRRLGADLPSRVLVNLGTNSGVTDLECLWLAELVGPDRDLTLVTVNIPAYPDIEQRSNRNLAQCAKASQARLVDWSAYAKANPDVVCPDGIHVSCGGASVYAAFILTGVQTIEPASDPADVQLPPPPPPTASFFEKGLAGAARAAAAREAAEAEAARAAQADAVARAAAEAEKARIAAQQAATLQRLQDYRPPHSPAELDVIVSRSNYGFRSVGSRLSAAASAEESPSS